jgi:N-acetyl-anhydromuramyl-L-alanine amidase AmpD
MKINLLPEYCYSGRYIKKVEGVIVHYFSARNVDPKRAFDMVACFDLFKDLNRKRGEREKYMTTANWPIQRQYASAHILIGRSGETWQILEYDKQAYHAGKSILNGRENCNAWTLGIELVGDRESGFSKEQYQALADCLLRLEGAYGFSRDNVAGHDKVRHNAIQAASEHIPKKYDPSGQSDGNGSNFDWFYLGKLMNDLKPNPEGVVSLGQLDDVIAADPNSQN